MSRVSLRRFFALARKDSESILDDEKNRNVLIGQNNYDHVSQN